MIDQSTGLQVHTLRRLIVMLFKLPRALFTVQTSKLTVVFCFIGVIQTINK